MARTENFQKILESYIRAFPKAEMFDSRGMAGEDFERLEEMMQTALDRGSPMTEKDLLYPVVEPDPSKGLLT